MPLIRGSYKLLLKKVEEPPAPRPRSVLRLTIDRITPALSLGISLKLSREFYLKVSIQL